MAWVYILECADGSDYVGSTRSLGGRLPMGWKCESNDSGAVSVASAKCNTLCHMSTLTIRTDIDVERALEALTSEGMSRSEAARTAILEAERAHRRARLRAEAAALRNDPEDVAASRELAAEMDAIRAW